jgi:hypothetical protein
VRAAELRTLGLDWKNTAQSMHRSIHTVSRWPQKYPERWAAAMATAERRALHAMTGESFGTLRRLLNAADEKVRLAAARWIALIRLQHVKLEHDAPPPPSDIHELAKLIATILETYSHEELAQLADQLDRLAGGRALPCPGSPRTGAA